MAHYAQIREEDNVVLDVFVGRDEDEIVDGISDWEEYYSEPGLPVKRTSYNTYGGVNLLGGTPFRKNYAGIGFTYDATRDAFVPPQPYSSWTLDETTCLWEAPVALPDDADTVAYVWDEEAGAWVVATEDAVE